ncbi:threonine/serine dehydratase [Acidaminobacter sp. JC074]|uniref:threonine ammonia-lyase n=1 Tax=Acidaminobacter sp. JC074 TaxID=2530199 RepID=UPI001F0FD204|nr:threonine/serine dehydratase [Acidaminobacter sp. JC074]MCH4890329.1 threonine/serine dehydratase [Acidaminobacter sp. JC074]
MQYRDIEKAYDRIKDYIYKTPLEESMYLSDEKSRVYLKLESLQKVKSFKIRGAFSKMTSLRPEEKEKGVVAISSGNHGVAVSYAATVLGIKNVQIIVPKNTPRSKVERIKYFGGNVILEGDNYDEAHHFGEKYIRENDLTEIDAYYKDPDVYAGQGTVGLEILKENPNIDTILVPIGGGGLITGLAVAAKALNPDLKIIGVQPEACPAMLMSMKENVFYKDYPTAPSICEALVGGVGQLAFERSHDLIDEIVLVSEDYVRKGVKHVVEKEKFIVEPSSAICVGALLQHKRSFGKHVAMVMSGGNLDESLMNEILNM